MSQRQWQTEGLIELDSVIQGGAGSITSTLKSPCAGAVCGGLRPQSRQGDESLVTRSSPLPGAAGESVHEGSVYEDVRKAERISNRWLRAAGEGLERVARVEHEVLTARLELAHQPRHRIRLIQVG